MEYRGLCAVALFYLISWLLSEDKSKISFRVLFSGLFLQFAIAILLLAVPSITSVLSFISVGLKAVSDATSTALNFCFGKLSDPSSDLGFMLALHGFPVLITISAISSLMMHWRILPIIIKFFSYFFRKTLAIGGTLGIAVSANIFTGMSETPLVVKSYLSRLTRSELFSLIVCGTAGIAGSVMVLYSVIIDPIMPNSIQHIISSVLIGIPAAITFSRIMVPETSDRFTESKDISLDRANNTIDAIYIGIMDGAKVMVTIIAMLMGFIALIEVANKILSIFTIDGAAVSIQMILGFIMAPLTWVMGVPWTESGFAGSLLGTKIITNEIVAYQEFARGGAELSMHTKYIITYALCGFANIGSIGVILGVYGSLVPHRKKEITNFALRAILAGAMTNCATASIVGLIYNFII